MDQELVSKELLMERYELCIERIRKIENEESVSEKYRQYFIDVANFITLIDRVKADLETDRWGSYSEEQKKSINHQLYEEIIGDRYESSYLNPSYAVKELGDEAGGLLTAMYAEIRGEIAYVYERKLENLTVCNELFLQIYNYFENNENVDIKEVKTIIYWYASDYCDLYVADKICEQIDPARSFVVAKLREIDSEDLSYLYDFGEYVSGNEYKVAEFLNEQSEETIEKIARTYVEGYERGFLATGKDLSKKSTVNIEYSLGFERVVIKAIELFAKIGLKPTIFRNSYSFVTKRKNLKRGFFGASANKQYEYDHKDDQGIFLDKKYIERKLDVMKNVFEKHKDLANRHAGPALIEVFGEVPFSPEQKECVIKLSKKQEELSLLFANKSSQLINKYIIGEERSYTIVAYPMPEIGEDFTEIFSEVIKINTLDASLYEMTQQTIIDVLDQGEYVHVVGKGGNKTNLKIALAKLKDPTKETLFENCVADVNIPVGEVFTSPKLEGTNGVLHVSKVYLNELQYKDLCLSFIDGKIAEYNCANYEETEQSKSYIKENLLLNHETLPLGEFAIGTNTTAYAVAKKYDILEKLPILIVEKMGPHFAIGDTCYSWEEDCKLYNPNGKEIVAKDNEVSILRKEDVSKAYTNCHTDITIPYEEIGEIAVLSADGRRIEVIKNGQFVLEGTELLNEPLKHL